jgi:hypothetical protein
VIVMTEAVLLVVEVTEPDVVMEELLELLDVSAEVADPLEQLMMKLEFRMTPPIAAARLNAPQATR